MSGWRPPTVSSRLSEETQRREAEASKALSYEQKLKWVEEFNRDLENIWSGMRLLWCPDPAPVEAVAMGARPGRWGILVPGLHGAPASVKPILGPDDSYVDPSLNASAIFENLKQQDWWNPRVRRERERAKVEAERAAERRKEQEREERDLEVLERFLAGTRTQVSMNRDTPWTQNAAGRKGRKR